MQAFLTKTAVKFADVLSVEEYLGKIMGIVDGQQCGSRQFRKHGAVEDAAEALIIFLHGLYLFILMRGRKVGEKRANFRQSECRDFDCGDGFRYRRQFPIGIFCESFP